MEAKPKCPACGSLDYKGELYQCPFCGAVICPICDMGADTSCINCKGDGCDNWRNPD